MIEVYFRINLPSGKEIELLADDASALLDALNEHYGETPPRKMVDYSLTTKVWNCTDFAVKADGSLEEVNNRDELLDSLSYTVRAYKDGTDTLSQPKLKEETYAWFGSGATLGPEEARELESSPKEPTLEEMRKVVRNAYPGWDVDVEAGFCGLKVFRSSPHSIITYPLSSLFDSADLAWKDAYNRVMKEKKDREAAQNTWWNHD